MGFEDIKDAKTLNDDRAEDVEANDCRVTLETSPAVNPVEIEVNSPSATLVELICVLEGVLVDGLGRPDDKGDVIAEATEA